MSRNSRFNPQREPLREHVSLALAENKIGGPFRFLNPTHAHYEHIGSKAEKDVVDSSNSDRARTGIGYRWTSRNNRKGRHALTLTQSAEADAQIVTPRSTSHPAEVAKGIWRMFVCYPFWDVSFDVAYIFTWGSIVWVINAFFALLPFTNPSTDFGGETLYGGGITAFIGATIFEIGSVLLMLEAVNENRSGCFGWAVENLVKEQEHHQHGHEGSKVQVARSDVCTHHHQNKGNLVGKASKGGIAAIEDDTRPEADGTPPGNKSWVWWPSAHELRTHYLHDLGFLACSSQMFGATIFWISGFTALPGIFDHMGQGLIDGVYWVPQVVGGCGFVVSGTLFMIETQKHWWQPATEVLGWWIGLWNLIGGIGFTLCPCFGFSSAHWAQEQAAVSTFWGSWAFLIGSVVQWYESLDKYPVERRN
ncbi:hypothetical protein H2198_003892 [Neophaeococcomyces mojaviensis]|uniref:Uncharacterized protein n=1 Tax=Neophaeococcomyces mojaviensis TaxID=3383035 RepID=A0ACC3AA70_9EURO|nr:hypothetical protein H2198_003892 [Knufia sp. JES_112]